MQDQKPTVKTAGGLHVPPGYRESDKHRQALMDIHKDPDVQKTMTHMRQISETQTAHAVEFAKAKLQESFPDAKIEGLIPITQVNLRQTPASTEQQIGELLAAYKAQKDIPPVNRIVIDQPSLMALLFHEVGAVQPAQKLPEGPPLPPPANVLKMPAAPPRNG